MKYVNGGKNIKIGDIVNVDGVDGIVVCDYENSIALDGYEGWLIKEELIGGGYFSSGIMVDTKDYGLIHYPDEDPDIKFIARPTER
ncbi:hypothetical protein ACJ9N4_01680 [Enterobacter sp. LM3]|uniref:Uncharacterized protein n=1 Tax=Enterobacter mori TaxID=539813 RepID=A0A7T0H290_9ENTR|nr:hypothetical protein [Enterobacter mori]QPK01766.1 hypothetical protein IDM36_06530 [Enterobacter mori]BBS36308.1 hypothetical protein WP5S18E01_11550 [Enterobacter cloacae]